MAGGVQTPIVPEGSEPIDPKFQLPALAMPASQVAFTEPETTEPVWKSMWLWPAPD
jgi:hypothetical protein